MSEMSAKTTAKRLKEIPNPLKRYALTKSGAGSHGSRGYKRHPKHKTNND